MAAMEDDLSLSQPEERAAAMEDDLSFSQPEERAADGLPTASSQQASQTGASPWPQIPSSWEGPTAATRALAGTVAEAEAAAKEFEENTLRDAAKKNQEFLDAVGAGGEERVAAAGFEETVEKIKAELDSGDVDVRGAMGQRMTAYLKANPTASAEYKALKQPGATMTLKRQWRLQWAAKELQGMTTVKKTKLEEYQIIEEEDGVYENLENIVIGEGGKDSAAAWRAAIAYATKAMKLGGQWLSYNAFTGRTDILYIKKTRKTRFNRLWSMYEEKMQQQSQEELLRLQQPQPAAAASTPQKVPDSNKLEEGVKPKQGKAKRGAEKDVEESPNKKAGTGKAIGQHGNNSKDNQKVLRQAELIRNLYNKACTMQISILQALQENPEWETLNNDKTKTQLAQLHADVTKEVAGEFAKSFLAQETSVVKAKYKKNLEEFWFRLKTFVDTVGAVVQKLDAQHTRLNNMYLASKA
jgi:hypothetical protein